MRSHPICPSATPQKWYAHRQTPQEEYDMISGMEHQYQRDRDRALQTSSTAFLRPSHTDCSNPTMDMNQVATFHDHHRNATTPMPQAAMQQQHQDQVDDSVSSMTRLFLGGAWPQQQQRNSENMTNGSSSDPTRTIPNSSMLR